MRHEIEKLIETNLDRRKSLAARLVIVRGGHRMIQEVFAKKLGVSTRMYQDFESGKRPLPADMLIEISDAFSIDLNWFLRGLEISDLEGCEEKVGKFVVDLLNYLRIEKQNIHPEGIAAIVSRWTTETRTGRTVSNETVHIWIDLLELSR